MKCTNTAIDPNAVSSATGRVQTGSGMLSSNKSSSGYDSFRADSGYSSSCSCQSIGSTTFSQGNVSSRGLQGQSDSEDRTSLSDYAMGDSGLVLDSVCESTTSLELNDLNKDDSVSPSSHKDCDKNDTLSHHVSCSRSDSGLGLDCFQESFSKLTVTEDENRINIKTSQLELPDNENRLAFNRVHSALQQTTIDNLNGDPRKRLQLAQDAYLPDKDGDTHLHLAVVRGHLEIILALIYLAPHPSYLDLQNNLYQTALHLAVLTSQPKVVRRLVLAGATLDIRNRAGNTPLHLACERGDLGCVRELTRPVLPTEVQIMKMSSPPSYRQPFISVPQNLEIRNYEGQMCVHLAAIAQYPEVIRHLKSYGANINAQEGKGGRTALCYAIEARNCNLVEFLVKECQADMNATTYAGITPFQMAFGMDPKIAEVLSNLGACQAFSTHSDSETDSDCSCDESMDTSEEFSSYFDLKINGEPLW